MALFPAFLMASEPSPLSISQLEEQLMQGQENPTLLLALAIAYANVGDYLSSKAYLDLIDALEPVPLGNAPRFSEANLAQIALLRERLLTKNSAQDVHKLLFRLETGSTSNANRGTELDSLNFSLGNGETFYLALDSQSFAQPSTFVNSTIEHNYLPFNQSWLISTALESTHFQEQGVDSNWLFRTSLRWKNHGITAYHFENIEAINGLFYNGQYQPLDWGVRVQTDRTLANTGLSHQWVSSSVLQRISTSVGKDWPNEEHAIRAGGEIENVKAKYQIAQDNWQVSTFLEWGRNSEEFNAFFYPGIKDAYQWLNITGEWVLLKNTSGRLNVKLQYDNKAHDIDLNSWENTSVSLVWSQKVF